MARSAARHDLLSLRAELGAAGRMGSPVYSTAPGLIGSSLRPAASALESQPSAHLHFVTKNGAVFERDSRMSVDAPPSNHRI
jgi:hypothetical protein